MFRAFSKKGKEHQPENIEDLQDVVQEGIELEYGLLAMDEVMDGQVAAAKEHQANMDNVFSRIAAGVLAFLEATVSFELENVRNAISTLSAAEDAAKKARDAAIQAGLRTSSFRPGAEYDLVSAEAGLMGAVSMFLSESIIDAAKALYKLRKVYFTLEDLRKHVRDTKQNPDFGTLVTPEEAKDPKFAEGMKLFAELHAKRAQRVLAKDEVVYPQTTIDEYITSGVEACSGIMHVVLSSIPPNLAKLLAMIGFCGNRHIGLRMLWDTAQNYTNVHSSLALLALLQFFDGPCQYKDIQLPREEEDIISDNFQTTDEGLDEKTTTSMTPAELQQTRDKLRNVLIRQRQHYSHGLLWQLQWGRMIAQTDVAAGVEILKSDECGPSQMIQVDGLLMFDKTIMLLTLHKWEEATDTLVALPDYSLWSHALYSYMAGACQLELYRKHRGTEQGEEYKRKATEFFTRAPAFVGKKKFLAKTPPFDKLVVRKCEQFKRQAEEQNLDLVDAIGPSVIHECMYFWNAHCRMPKHLLEESLEAIKYSGQEGIPLKESEADAFSRKLFTAIYLRCLGRIEEGQKYMDELIPQIINPSGPEVPNKVKYYPISDPWAGPVALYERALYEFAARGKEGAEDTRKWLRLCSNWDDDYELSTRVNMRVCSATDRLDIYRL